MNNKKVGFKEVWRALKQIPKTITIIRKVDKKGFTLIVMLSMIAGAFPVITLVLSQELINSIVIRSYRSKMSVLFQDFVKYELSLRENIGFGDIQNLNNDEKMVQMLHKLQTKFLQTDNGSYNLDLQLGNWFEDGCQLSQGQWQKIALGRVYFRDASFYILDEPNAALDTVSEREVFEKFFELSKDKIGVFISHRLNAAKMADKIIVLVKLTLVSKEWLIYADFAYCIVNDKRINYLSRINI